MASRAPDAALEDSDAPNTLPETQESTAADEIAQLALEPEIDALSSSAGLEVQNENPTGNVSGEINEKNEDENKEKGGQDQADAARDLDMLADTVRSIARPAGDGVDDEERKKEDKTPLMETGENAGLGAELIATGGSGNTFLSETGKSSALGDSNKEIADVFEVGIADVGEEVERAAQGTSGGATTGGLVSSTTTGNIDVIPVAKKPPKSGAAESGQTVQVPKKKKRAEYSEETRAICVRRHAEGASYAAISKELGIPHDTVRAIVRKAKRTGSVSSAPRSGRPRKTSGIVDKVILESVKANKQCTAKAIQQELLRVFGIKISPETVRRRVLEHTKQRISMGVSGHLPTVENDKRESASDNMLDASTPPQGRLSITDSSLSDSVSFQQLLYEEGNSTSDVDQAMDSLASTRTAHYAHTSSSTAQTVSPNVEIDDTDEVQAAVPSQIEDESSPPKRQKRSEYSIATREKCVALHAQGRGYRRIGKVLNMPHTTVRAIVEKAQRTGTVLPAKRSGRPRKTNEIVDKVILQAVKANEKSSARIIKEQLLAAYGVRISCETIRRRVKDHSRQCMLAAASAGVSDTFSDGTTTSRQPEQELLTMAITGSSSMPAANIIAFDENGVHL
ncbi:unnamed protein product [Phytophthora fragariaefolia]|uniref:Unnamed protein product n=1 Tax=Phytophthora fragariaefolia TaxID=1490495 RepID=A0A9W6YIH5_9STRA|nr:unnamed protein product [Phytophthora fragariaefolia]